MSKFIFLLCQSNKLARLGLVYVRALIDSRVIQYAKLSATLALKCNNSVGWRTFCAH